MASSPPPARRVAPATIALALAGLLLAATAIVAIARSGGEEAPETNAMAVAATAQEGQSMEAMIASLQTRLRQDPDNHEGWFLLGMTYRNAERFPEAEQAFRRAMELAPRNADYAAYLGETLLLRGGNTPPPEAATLFRRALELQPGNAQARYYLATIRDVQGDHRGAVDDLITLLRSAPAGAPWAEQVRGAVTSIAREHNIDIAGRLPAPTAAPAPPPSTATAAIPGPNREQMEAARAIPPSQQDQMVNAMVEGLAARLRQNPRDAEGWIRLMRSRMVLHQPDAAAAALRSGLAAFPNDAATQTRLRNSARELGVPGVS